MTWHIWCQVICNHHACMAYSTVSKECVHLMSNSFLIAHQVFMSIHLLLTARKHIKYSGFCLHSNNTMDWLPSWHHATNSAPLLMILRSHTHWHHHIWCYKPPTTCSETNCLSFEYSDWKHHIVGLVQDYSISIANALEILQSCTKPSVLVQKNII